MKEDFTINILNDGIEISRNDLKIIILDRLQFNDFTSRSKKEIVELLKNNTETYSCMCFEKNQMPFSHIENHPLQDCISRNLDALEKLDRIDIFRNEHCKDGIYKVFLKEIIEP